MATKKRKTRGWRWSTWEPIVMKWMDILNIPPKKDIISFTRVVMVGESACNPVIRNAGSSATGLFQQMPSNLIECSKALVRYLGQARYERLFGKDWNSSIKSAKYLRITDVGRGPAPTYADKLKVGEIAIAAYLANIKAWSGSHLYQPTMMALFQHMPIQVWGSKKYGIKGVKAWYRETGNYEEALKEILYLNMGKTATGHGGGGYILYFYKNWRNVFGSYPTDVRLPDRKLYHKVSGNRAARFAFLDEFYGEKWVRPVERSHNKSKSAKTTSQRNGGGTGATSKTAPSSPRQASPTRATDRDVIFSDGIIKGTPFTISQFITPEERMLGINADQFYMNDWYLNHLSKLQSDKLNRNKRDESSAREESISIAAGADSSQKGSAGSFVRSDLLTDPRQRYISSQVEAEFWRRKMGSRSVPAAPGGFNPYPVAGLPGLVLDAERPVLAMVENVSHQISVSGASGNTTVSFSRPRFWDEGEVWYYLTGYNVEDRTQVNGSSPPVPELTAEQAALYRRFPFWLNRKIVPTNNYNNTDEVLNNQRSITDLDRFYNFLLGTLAVDYMSNHASVKSATPEVVSRTIKEREPGPFEVKSSTLEIREYNRLIAAKKRLPGGGEVFEPWTLAARFWGGDQDPSAIVEPSVAYKRSIEYVERYGVKEKELLVDILGCLPVRAPDRLVYTGGPFGPPGQPSELQAHILDYIDSITNKLEGGVR